jgi:hypothetical protein
MVNLLKGWLKIYLFYGAIFFLLGLFGLLASDEVRLTVWSARQIQRISRIWSADTFQVNEDQIVPAFTSQFDSIMLQVYRPKDTNIQFDELLQQLQIKLRGHFRRVIALPVADLNKLDLESGNPPTPWVLVGFTQTKNPGIGSEILCNNLYFGIPDQASPLFTGKLLQTLTAKLPVVTFNKPRTEQTGIFKLSWNTTDNSEQVNSEVFAAFIKILTEDSWQMIANKTLD